MSQVGLRDLYMAVLLTDDPEGASYETPERITGAISATINPTVNTEELFADDQLWESVSALGAIDVEIETADLPLATRALLMGQTLVDGVLMESASTIMPHVALAFRSQKSNGFYRYVWLLKGVPQPIAEEFSTRTDSIEHQTPRLRLTFMPRIYDQQWKHTADDDNPAFTGAATWFDEVPVSDEVITITQHPLGLTVTEGSITEDISVTAEVTGEGTPSYQWYSNTANTHSGGSEMAGEESDTLDIPTDLSPGTYYYYCQVSASGATPVLSNIATVVVEPSESE